MANRLLLPLDSEIIFARDKPCSSRGLDLEVTFAGYPSGGEIAKIAAALGVPIEDCDDVWGGCPSCDFGTTLVVHGWIDRTPEVGRG